MLFVISSFSIWDWLQIFGTGMVFVGVAGELFLEFKKFPYNPTSFPALESSKRKIEIISLMVLLLGLSLEIAVLPHSLLEVANLEKSNLELQAKLQPRTINTMQITNFIYLTEKIPKIPIKVCIGPVIGDNQSYAYQIRCLLILAGFKTDPSAGDLGITVDTTAIMVRNMGHQEEAVKVYVDAYSTNNTVTYFPLMLETNSNGFTRPIVTENDSKQVYQAIMHVFNELQIPTHWWGTSNRVNPGEFQFFIVSKDI